MGQHFCLYRCKGFTLLELIVVITILGIVSVSITSFYRDGVEGYLQAEARLGLAGNARLPLERIGREVREAMPNSVRVNSASGSNCVEFVPIAGASYYTDLPTTQPDNKIMAVLDNAPSLSSTLYVMVIPLNTAEVYNTASGHMAQVSSINTGVGGNQMQINLTANVRFVRRSPLNRIYFVRQPVSFCASGGNLDRFTNYGFFISQPTALSGGSRLMENVLLNSSGSPINLFRYDAGTLNRSGLLQINLHLQGRDESIALEHEVHVRNVP